MSTINAATEIERDLALEAKARARRAWGWLVLLLVSCAGFAIATGIKPTLEAPDTLAAAVGLSFVLLGVAVSTSPQLRLGRWSARALLVMAAASPLLATLLEDEHAGVGHWGCAGTIAGMSVVLLVVSRLLLGGLRRRFGGASELQAAAAVLAGTVAVGLHCQLGNATHLVTHAGAAAIGILLGRLVLR